MLIKDFVTQSASTALYPHRGAYGGLTYIICGLAGEVGECFEVIKKIIRDNDGKITDTSRIKSEVGDVLWYWSQLLFESGTDVGESDLMADDLQESVVSKYFTDTQPLKMGDPVFLYQQIFLLSRCHIAISEILRSYDKIGSSEDFDEHGKEISRLTVNILKILGIFLSTMDIKLSEVMQMNLDKLSARKDAGKLQGSGEALDERV